MLCLSIVLIASLCWRLEVNAWNVKLKSPKLQEGSACDSSLGSGICMLIEKCQPFVEGRIKYEDLKRCSFIGVKEVSCCPVEEHFWGQNNEQATKQITTNDISLRPRIGMTSHNINREGTVCRFTSRTGKCTRISQCKALLNCKVQYADLERCSFIGNEEVICCPPTTRLRSPRSHLFRTTNKRNSNEGSVCHLTSEMGKCTRISQCKAFRNKEVQYADLKRCSFIENEEAICCPFTAPSRTKPTWKNTGPKKQRNQRTSTGTSKLRPSSTACKTYKSKSTRRLTPNILDGSLAFPGEYPHVGAVLYASETAGVKFVVRCGASLISEYFALTAAHCVVRDIPILVRFGSVDWDPKDGMYRFDAMVKKTIKHEDYLPHLTYNDIALIEFTEKIHFTPLVYPACLHATTEDLSYRTDLIIAGWGSTGARNKLCRFGNSEFPKIIFSSGNSQSQSLYFTNLRTLSLKDCNDTFAQDGFQRQYVQGLHYGQYCAYDPSGVTNKDSCHGDSGGPLMMDVDNTIWELVGIVSFGKGCGTELPSVYTRVARYLDWIEERVWQKGNE